MGFAKITDARLRLPGKKAVMSHSEFTADDFVIPLSQVLNQPVYDVRIIKHTSRPYSHIWFLEVYTKNNTLCVAVKSWSHDSIFRRQLGMLHTAREICANEKDICIPYIGSWKKERMLFMPQVLDSSIVGLCRISLQRPIHIRYLRHKQCRLQAACTKAGTWLRKWHTKTTGSGELSAAFDAYLSNRKDCLRLLNHRERHQLLALTRNLGTDTTCIPHGDFTPFNLLWSPGKLTILDFGLTEWERMTPWWDYSAMEIGLSHALRFTMKSLGAWFPALPDTAIGAFRAGYGESNYSSRARFACLAVRHLVLYADDTRKGKRYRRRSEWHKLQLQRVLAEAKQARLP